MRAAVFREKGILKVEDVPEPVVGPRDVLLKVTHCAICGSDLHRYAYGMLRPGAILGHEYSGTVADKGADVSEFHVGDRVTRSGGPINPWRDTPPFPPRFSAKERGFLSTQRPGAYAEYMLAGADMLMPVPDGVTNLEAALTEPLTVALHAVRLSRLRLGDQVLVIGAGPIGLLAEQCASVSGAARVLVSEINAARRAAASALGADVVLDPTRVNMIEEILRHTGLGVDIAFECAGAQPTFQQALEALRGGGQVVVVSLAWEPVYCLPVDWVAREVEVKTSYACLASEWPMAMGLLEQRKVQVQPMISRLVPLEDIQAAFQELLNPETQWVQAVVTFE
ncbi:MAG TPA: zinc-binding dehydrogenase [Candidatus Methylomirabilis sp.]|nr:zinc-binding dehydrogenase [Candidatus Methylomirabilis sp.]